MPQQVRFDFWRDKSVLITGHTGFKGGWLALWLARLGARVHGLALPPDEGPVLYRQAGVGDLLESEALLDLRDRTRVREYIGLVQPELVIHLAAQPLVRRSYREPFETFEVNVMGTTSLLDALLDEGSARACLCITSDKCYHNHEWVHPYREADRLGGHDPYSASKAAAELLIASYRDSFAAAAELSLASARAGNVIGGGDWAEDRLVPDCARAFAAGESVELRSPAAIRPWQHVLDPLAGYLQLVQAQFEQPGRYDSAWNFGPRPGDEWTVQQLVERLADGWAGAQWCVAADADQQPHEHQLLRLDISRARAELGWRPRLDAQQALDWSREWYQCWRQRGDDFDAAGLCQQQIDDYMQILKND